MKKPRILFIEWQNIASDNKKALVRKEGLGKPTV